MPGSDFANAAAIFWLQTVGFWRHSRFTRASLSDYNQSSSNHRSDAVRDLLDTIARHRQSDFVAPYSTSYFSAALGCHRLRFGDRCIGYRDAGHRRQQQHHDTHRRRAGHPLHVRVARSGAGRGCGGRQSGPQYSGNGKLSVGPDHRRDGARYRWQGLGRCTDRWVADRALPDRLAWNCVDAKRDRPRWRGPERSADRNLPRHADVFDTAGPERLHGHFRTDCQRGLAGAAWNVGATDGELRIATATGDVHLGRWRVFRQRSHCRANGDHRVFGRCIEFRRRSRAGELHRLRVGACQLLPGR